MRGLEASIVAYLLFWIAPTRAFTRHQPSTSLIHRATTTTTSFPSLLKFSHDNENSHERSDALRKSLLQVGQVFDNTNANQIRVGSTVVANSNVPELQIWQFQSYTVQDLWDQGARQGMSADDDDTIELVEKIACCALDDPIAKPGYTRYVSLYSSKHHQTPVTVDTAQVTLVSLQTEVKSSVLQALPLFGFWTALAFSFASKYNERYGGTLWDAFWGR